MHNKVLVIAEAGVNHNGDMILAKKLIESAAESGADLVKFQTFKASHQVIASAQKAPYQLKSETGSEGQFEMLKKLELTKEMHYTLMEHCKKCNIGFLSTAFDIDSVNFLAHLDLDFFKIPSGEITNLPYLRHIGKLKKSVILSTGMSTLGDVESAINLLISSGTLRSKIIILHCTTEYPAPIEEVNLLAMHTLREAFKVNVGYSDHTQGIEIAIAAVAMGAKVIEKHFTLDCSLPGPDHIASIEPDEMASMIKAIRNIELAMGDGIKKLTPSEILNQQVIRKSIVARLHIKAGELFNPENITVKRPGTGISPMFWDDILQTYAKRDYKPDEMIQP